MQTDHITILQWVLVIGSSLALFGVAPLARTAAEFFGGRTKDRAPTVVALTSSLVISWLFAKSITNAANLGLAFGLIGGVAYAAYYLSFAVAGWVIYRMRTVGGYTSIHHFLRSNFGRGAVLVFSLLICFRLFNEVWSNTMVIGSYFGGVGDTAYYLAILVFTALTLAYSLKGGMSSSILTDVIQMALFGVLLVVILGAIIPRINYSAAPLLSSGEWTMAAGGNLLLVAILQSFSYPFHDPVLTDRAFLSSPQATLKAFLYATPIGFGCILLFSFVGIYGQVAGVEGQAPVEVAKLLGGPILLVMNFIMITSAASTLDSTFTSFSKLAVVDIAGAAAGAKQRGGGTSLDAEYLTPTQPTPSVKRGRIAMVAIVVLGTIPVFLNPTILSATTVSGAMVFGLAPVFCLWNTQAGPLSFHLSVGFGLLCGLAYALGVWPDSWILTSGKYNGLLSVSLVETIGCTLLYLLPIPFTKNASR
ncbi:sodium:solute symporter [Lewinella sp. 4G2]|uniref:sodium:solute symporter n=1 Tax=Lewinella sp. 4G2 TaxID=1803372 RepID=UPI0007B49D66|nr:sodium:solute symporter [Lewinella sp. 4G2]OAV44639.1 sodium:solute symporter [Lewinella sp. 4G2]